ncbi:MAG TPA: multicopper oxidase domain-containing protein [Vicinamibacterales bacterium]
MRLRARLMLVAAAIALCPLPAGAQAVETHDNLTSAGTLRDGVLRVSIWAGRGGWSPRGDAPPGYPVLAFGEEGRPLAIPSPLIRVPQGTAVHVSIRNTLTSPLVVRGLCDRSGPCEPVRVPAGQTADVRFLLPSAGTFHYWASTGGPIDRREGDDSQMGGAIVVDPSADAPRDRIFVMGLMRDPARPDDEITVINGRSWPQTERLSYVTGETARWRVVNLTSVAHAMHLHGFYFQVESTGNGLRDTLRAPDERLSVVTEQMPPGGTMTMAWVPERAGNWLFHCHMLVHMTAPDSPGGSHAAHGGDTAAGMAGLVLGVHITGPSLRPAAPVAAARKIDMVIDSDTRLDPVPSFKVSLTSHGTAFPRIGGAAPGPVMVLTRGVPVEVDIVNRLREPTAIHWHGIELESYDDGVPGFGGTSGSITPAVEPGGRFTARFTPSRAGTFIYHTHWHNPAQLAGGIYGPIVVLEPGEVWDPERDHVIVMSLEGKYHDSPGGEAFAINGERTPRPLDLDAGVAHRLRLINITGNNVALTLQLLSKFDPVQWTLLGKDGAAAPDTQRKPRPARQLVAVGETYDFELPAMAPAPVGLWLELRRGNGEFLMQWPMRVR